MRHKHNVMQELPEKITHLLERNGVTSKIIRIFKKILKQPINELEEVYSDYLIDIDWTQDVSMIDLYLEIIPAKIEQLFSSYNFLPQNLIIDKEQCKETIKKHLPYLENSNDEDNIDENDRWEDDDVDLNFTSNDIENMIKFIEPDYSYLMTLDAWDATRACFLLFNVDTKKEGNQLLKKILHLSEIPKILKKDFLPEVLALNLYEVSSEGIKEQVSTISKTIELILLSLAAGTLKYPDNDEKIFFNRKEFIEWAIAKNIPIPKQIKELHVAEQMKDGIKIFSDCPFLNPKHEFFAHELKVAVITWMNLFVVNKFPAGKKSLKQNIIDHLNEYNDNLSILKGKTNTNSEEVKLSKGAIERIAMIINPRHQGGAPKS